MTNYFEWRGAQIAYSVSGQGKNIVFLHGFLEDKEMWNGFIPHFDSEYCCLRIDLLGHGQSQDTDHVLSMSLMAQMVLDLLESLEVNSFAIVGHSMGGYVALEIAKRVQNRVHGLCLFHSKILADSEKKRNDRIRAVRAVGEGKRFFIQQSIKTLFGASNRKRFSDEIDRLSLAANDMDSSTIQSALLGMRNRKENLETYLNNPKNYSVLGEWDEVVSLQDERDVLDANKAPYTLLSDVGHMSHIEDPASAMSAIQNFLYALK